MPLEKALNKFLVETTIFCPFARLIDKLPPEDRTALQYALDNKYPNITIAKALRDEGYRIAEISIMEHRKGLCRCPQNKKPSKKS